MSHVTKLRLKPLSEGPTGQNGEPSLPGGRSAAAAKTASKAETCFIRKDLGFRRCLVQRCSTVFRKRSGVFASAVTLLPLVVCLHAAAAQGQRGQGPPAPPPTGKPAAPIDLTGYWVSIVSEDWRWRMVTPAKGDYTSIPINAEAKKVADTWDPVKDEAAGEACKSYGAPAIMRVPGRLHITWQDDNTLKVDTDAGTQTRLFHFGDWKSPGGAPAWQGESVAQWETPRAARGFGVDTTTAGGGPPREAQPKFGSLKVATTHLRPGYLRKNGVPYSANATLTEYWDLSRERSGAQWIVITTLVNDPMYLQSQWVTSLNFRKEPDGSKWDPSPCSAKW